jgi:IS30 family transposase
VRRQEAKYQGMKIIAHPRLHAFVEQKLMEGRSPESIAGRTNNHEKHLPRISADSIERFLKSVYGRRIEAHRNYLIRRRTWRRRRPKVSQLKDRKFIDIRPAIINRRGRVSDVEADFIVSGKQGTGIILTVVDRKLRVSFIEKVLPVSIENVHRAFIRIKKRFPEMRTITTDNDLLLQRHKALEKLLRVKIYFCHPYHSWEKGTIENTNGEIRKSILKGSNISLYSEIFIRRIETKLNERYMKCLEYQTPKEALVWYRKQKQRRAALVKKKT